MPWSKTKSGTYSRIAGHMAARPVIYDDTRESGIHGMPASTL